MEISQSFSTNTMEKQSNNAPLQRKRKRDNILIKPVEKLHLKNLNSIEKVIIQRRNKLPPIQTVTHAPLESNLEATAQTQITSKSNSLPTQKRLPNHVNNSDSLNNNRNNSNKNVIHDSNQHLQNLIENVLSSKILDKSPLYNNVKKHNPNSRSLNSLSPLRNSRQEFNDDESSKELGIISPSNKLKNINNSSQFNFLTYSQQYTNSIDKNENKKDNILPQLESSTNDKESPDFNRKSRLKLCINLQDEELSDIVPRFLPSQISGLETLTKVNSSQDYIKSKDTSIENELKMISKYLKVDQEILEQPTSISNNIFNEEKTLISINDIDSLDNENNNHLSNSSDIPNLIYGSKYWDTGFNLESQNNNNEISSKVLKHTNILNYKTSKLNKNDLLANRSTLFDPKVEEAKEIIDTISKEDKSIIIHQDLIIKMCLNPFKKSEHFATIKELREIRSEVRKLIQELNIITRLFENCPERYLDRRKQIDLDQYSDDNLIKRFDNKFSKRIRHEIKEIWRNLKKNDYTFITKKVYSDLLIRIYQIICPEMKISEYERNIQKDWENDSRGSNVIRLSHFLDSFFMLSDLWTLSSSESEYIKFISSLHETLLKSPISERKLFMNKTIVIPNEFSYQYEDFYWRINEDEALLDLCEEFEGESESIRFGILSRKLLNNGVRKRYFECERRYSYLNDTWKEQEELKLIELINQWNLENLKKYKQLLKPTKSVFKFLEKDLLHYNEHIETKYYLLCNIWSASEKALLYKTIQNQMKSQNDKKFNSNSVDWQSIASIMKNKDIYHCWKFYFNKKEWTNEEDLYLLKQVKLTSLDKITWEIVSDSLNSTRSKGECKKRFIKQFLQWDKESDNILQNCITTASTIEEAFKIVYEEWESIQLVLPRRTFSSCIFRLTTLKNYWTTFDDRKLFEIIGKSEFKESFWNISPIVGKTSIQCKDRFLMKMNKWTSNEDDKLIEIFNTATILLKTSDLLETHPFEECCVRFIYLNNSWSNEEDSQLLSLNDELINDSEKLTKMFSFHTSDSCRKRFEFLHQDKLSSNIENRKNNKTEELSLNLNESNNHNDNSLIENLNIEAKSTTHLINQPQIDAKELSKNLSWLNNEIETIISNSSKMNINNQTNINKFNSNYYEDGLDENNVNKITRSKLEDKITIKNSINSKNKSYKLDISHLNDKYEENIENATYIVSKNILNNSTGKFYFAHPISNTSNSNEKNPQSKLNQTYMAPLQTQEALVEIPEIKTSRKDNFQLELFDSLNSEFFFAPIHLLNKYPKPISPSSNLSSRLIVKSSQNSYRAYTPNNFNSYDSLQTSANVKYEPSILKSQDMPTNLSKEQKFIQLNDQVHKKMDEYRNKKENPSSNKKYRKNIETINSNSESIRNENLEKMIKINQNPSIHDSLNDSNSYDEQRKEGPKMLTIEYVL